ncbi:MAG TPA: RNA methyltransferase [Draconibacterium sp.]|nr:RNA methyltransferase [Draconibacterium sp.]
MISKNTIKLIKSLDLKKIREKESLFLVEGDKNVSEVLESKFKIEKLFATSSFLLNNKSKLSNAKLAMEVTKQEIQQASLLKSPQNSIALCELPNAKELPENIDSNLWIYLDEIQDPGNLGTIIRICDWFGIDHLFCSPKTADLFNPKVIQSSMGSFCRVNVWYTPFEPVSALANKLEIPVYGAFLNGENIYEQKLPQRALLVLGNEGNGICPEIEAKIKKKIKIPRFSENSKTAESLNVSVAAAIICSEFKRQNSFSDYSK